MADDAPKPPDEAEEELDAIEAAANAAADRLMRADEAIADTARAAADAAQPDDDFEQRLQDLERRAHAQKTLRDVKKDQVARRQATEAENAQGLGVGLTIAYAILGMPLIGAGVGWLLDNQFGTKLWVGVGVLAGATGGVAFALFALQRMNRPS